MRQGNGCVHRREPGCLAIERLSSTTIFQRISLEDVFIHFTGRSLREEGATKGQGFTMPRRFT